MITVCSSKVKAVWSFGQIVLMWSCFKSHLELLLPSSVQLRHSAYRLRNIYCMLLKFYLSYSSASTRTLKTERSSLSCCDIIPQLLEMRWFLWRTMLHVWKITRNTSTTSQVSMLLYLRTVHVDLKIFLNRLKWHNCDIS